MSINLTDKLDEAIAELKREEAISRKKSRSAIAKECWRTSKILNAKMKPETVTRYGIDRNDLDQSTTSNVKTGWQSPNASWRSKKLTGKQINYLHKLEYKGRIPSTRGEAADIISKLIHKSNLSASRKNIARKFITKIINHDDTPGIIIEDSSDFLICDSETQIESIKLERQLWRESLA